MPNNSSLYGSGTPPSGTVSSSNYTTLYSGGNNFVPSGDNVIISGTLTVNGCSILTDCSTFNLLPFNATTINFGGSSTAMSIGSGTGVTTIQNQLSTANYLFPLADGLANQVLITDGSGVLSFADVQSLDTNYNIQADTATGGANLTLVGSDSTTDSVKFASAGGTTVSRTDANTITISSIDTNTTYTQNASVATGGANLNLVGSDATTDTIKFAGGTNVTVVATDANTITINAPDTNTTYTQNASATTGGANLNLVGSDATIDPVKFASGTGITVSRTDADTITITNTGVVVGVTSITGTANQVIASSSTGAVTLSLPQDIATTSNPVFAGITGGNVTVGVVTDNTISTTTGNLVLASATNEIDASTANITASSFTIDSRSTIETTTLTTTSVATVSVVDTTRNVMKCVVSIVDNVTGERHAVEALALEKGTTAFLTTYAEMYSSAALATFSTDVSAGVLRLLVTPISTNSTTFNVVRTSLN